MQDKTIPNNEEYKARYDKLNRIDKFMYRLIWINSNTHFFIAGILVSLALGSIPNIIDQKFNLLHFAYILLLSISWLFATYFVYKTGSISNTIQKKSLVPGSDEPNANKAFLEFENKRDDLIKYFIRFTILLLFSIFIIIIYISCLSQNVNQCSFSHSETTQTTENNEIITQTTKENS